MLPLSLTSVVILCKNSKSVLHVNRIIKFTYEFTYELLRQRCKPKNLLIVAGEGQSLVLNCVNILQQVSTNGLYYANYIVIVFLYYYHSFIVLL